MVYVITFPSTPSSLAVPDCDEEIRAIICGDVLDPQPLGTQHKLFNSLDLDMINISTKPGMGVYKDFGPI